MSAATGVTGSDGAASTDDPVPAQGAAVRPRVTGSDPEGPSSMFRRPASVRAPATARHSSVEAKYAGELPGVDQLADEDGDSATGDLGEPAPEPETEPEAESEGESEGEPGTEVESVPGTDEEGAESTAARDVVGAAETIDPALLAEQPGDSEQTAQARDELAVLAGRLETVVARYETVAAAAARAQRHAERVHADLLDAQAHAQDAAERYREDRRTLVTMVNRTYAAGSLGTVGLVLSSGDSDDLVSSLSVAEQLNADESNVVAAAQDSADRLAEAESRAASLDEDASAAAARADHALDEATQAREDVSDDVRAARTLLAESVLSDQADAALDAAALAGLRMAYGTVVFPLAPGAAFVDQGNFGHRSGRWASYHTGNDFSTPCGTPVLAATAGTVEVRTDQPWSGRWLVLVRTAPGSVATWYAHMQALSVADGDQVLAGQVIGAVGTEGNSSGCHLHFEYHPAGGSIYEDATDPVPWLRALGAYPYA